MERIIKEFITQDELGPIRVTIIEKSLPPITKEGTEIDYITHHSEYLERRKRGEYPPLRYYDVITGKWYYREEIRISNRMEEIR